MVGAFLVRRYDDGYVMTHTDTRRRVAASVHTSNFQVVCFMRHHARV